jgi:hypothetical protein
MSEAVIRIKDGEVSGIRIRRARRLLTGRWTRPRSEAEWDEVLDPVRDWIDLIGQIEFYDWQNKVRAAAEERRAAGLPEPEYDEPF